MPIALVTGASRGIGKALVAELASRGTEAWGTSRSDPPEDGRWLRLDVRDPISAFAAARRFGDRPLDLLVCNAGIYPDRAQSLGEEFDAGLWAGAFAVNVAGVFLAVQAFLPALRRAEAAKIAIISSQMGSTARAPGGSYIYRASKAAAVNLGRNLAADLRGEGIAVGIYHPGWVRTEMGGTGADIDPAVSARGLADRFAALGPATTGVFETWEGTPVPF
jgi:NAD(P)-dependent dehydrogenase (short-subunit alcohol dehydrogenase family)